MQVNDRETGKLRIDDLHLMKHTELRIIVPLVIGAILIVLGVTIIVASREVVTGQFGYDNVDGRFVYVVYDERELVTGIILALAGTATATASLTNPMLGRRKKSV